MATSGTFSFNPTVDEIIEEAFEKVGGEFVSGIEAESAIRSLNYVLQHLSNKGYPLSKIDFTTVDVSSGTTLPISLGAQYLDVMNAVVRKDSTDYTMHRIDIWDYNRIATKSQTGIPTQYAVNKTRDDLEFYTYLTPTSGYQFRLYIAEQVEDVDNLRQTLDIDPKYIPAVVYGLAFELAQKRAGYPGDKLAFLGQQYEIKLREVYLEDRNRSDLVISIDRRG